MEQYRVVIKETSKSKSIIHENITYSEMVQYYAKHHKDASEKVFQLKIYQRKNSESFWVVEAIFENGEMVQYFDIKKTAKPPVERVQYGLLDFNKLMNTLFVDSVPSRRDDVWSLVWDYATGKDLTKPKLTLLDGAKE